MKALETLKMDAVELFEGMAAIDNAVSTVRSICDKAVKTDRCEVEKFLPDILNNLSNAHASYSALASILLSVDGRRRALVFQERGDSRSHPPGPV